MAPNTTFAPPLTAIIDTATGTLTEIGRIYLRTLADAVGALASVGAAYWVSHPDPTLTGEQNLGGLASGYLKITTAIGIATPSSVALIPQADVTGLVAALAGLTPIQTPVTFAGLPGAPTAGMIRAVSDSNTVVWGAVIAGGGGNQVLAYYNGTAWTVAGR